MRTIAKVINAINSNSKSAAVPPVLQSVHPPAAQQSYRGPGPSVPPDPQPTHQQHQQRVMDRYHAPPLGQPPPMIQPQQASPGALGSLQTMQHSPVQHPSVPGQAPYGMLSPLIPAAPGPVSSPPHPGYTRIKVEPKVDVPVSDAMLSWKQPRDSSSSGYYATGSYGAGSGQIQGSNPYDRTRPPVSSSSYMLQPAPIPAQQPSVLENLINSPHFGSPSPSQARHLNGSGIQAYSDLPHSNSTQQNEQRMYVEKLRLLRPYCDGLRARAQQCRLDGNENAASKFDTICSVIDGKMRVSFEYVLQIEAWIYRKQDFLQAAVLGTGTPQPQPQPQPQPLVDAVNAVLLNGEAQGGYAERIPPSANISPTAQWQQAPVPVQAMTSPVPVGMSPQPGGVMPAAMQMPPTSVQSVVRHSVEHGYQRHSPYPHPVRGSIQQPGPLSRHGSPRMPQQQQLQQQQQQAINTTMAGVAPYADQNRIPTGECGVEDLYVMEDFLPTPVEAIPNSSLPPMEEQLPEAARQELLLLSDRFTVDPNIEQTPDSQVVIIKVTLTSHNVPPLRVVIPKTYPSGVVMVDRAALDLDSFFFDDLQNVIHERLAQPGLKTVTNFLETWESTVRTYYMGHQQQTLLPITFDDILQNTTFDDFLT